MKKLFLLLVVVALAAFLFVGCIPTTPGEGEGEGEGEPEVSVQIAGAVELGGKLYVKGGSHDITVTFSAPVEGIVQVSSTDCTGDYTKGTIVLWPDAERKVWTGSLSFACSYVSTSVCPDTCSVQTQDCCATVITIISGACEADTCYVLPVIVDCEPPKVDLAVRFLDCGCPTACEPVEGAYMEFTSNLGTTCDPKECCEDDCTEVGDWKFYIKATGCDEDCVLAESTGCSVEGKTNCDCLIYPDTGEKIYTITFTLKDVVGNAIPEKTFTVTVDTDEVVKVNGSDYTPGAWVDIPITGICLLD